MLRLTSATALAFLATLASALAEPPPPRETPPAAPDSAAPAAPARLTLKDLPGLGLDELFAKLPENAGTPIGRGIEVEILRRWTKSGSDTADLLLSWAVKAMDEKKYPLALDILDQIVILKPDFAEAWNKRATVYYMIDDYGASIADIRETLSLEPRHFGALAGLGMIFQSMDRDEEAMRAFKRALDINPQLDRIKEALERLEKEAANNDI